MASPRVSHDSIEKQKDGATYLDQVELAATEVPRGRLQPPESVARLTPEERTAMEKRLTRKIDIRLLPPVIIMYILNYLDRNSIATARIAGRVGMEADLGLVGSQYETAVSILFVGYILMQVPSNLFLNKVGKPALYLPAVMAVWGAISACTAAVNSYTGLVLVRFFLGFVEAAYFPGCLFYLSCWYTRKELAFRSAILYSGSLISGAFAGLIAAGITNGMDGKAGISAWRWLFIIEGVVTVAVAAIAFFILPNFPLTTKWLKDEERELAVWRLKEDIGVDDYNTGEKESFFHGFVLALKDVKVYILMIMFLGVVSAASVTNFFPSVVETLGFDHMTTLLLTAPPYVLAVFTTFACAWHADKTGERFLHIAIPATVGIAAFILAACTTSMAPRYVAMMIMLSGIYCAYVIILSWISNSIPRPPAKRAAGLALINAVSNSSSIYASYLYTGAPRYTLAFSVNIGTLFLSILAAAALRILLTRENRKIERGMVLTSGIGGTFRYLV